MRIAVLALQGDFSVVIVAEGNVCLLPSMLVSDRIVFQDGTSVLQNTGEKSVLLLLAGEPLAEEQKGDGKADEDAQEREQDRRQDDGAALWAADTDLLEPKNVTRTPLHFSKKAEYFVGKITECFK